MIGPLLFAIVQASLERGFRAGLSVAVGIWSSDMLYILVVWRSVEAIATVTAWPGFKFWAGLGGGLLLLGFGVGSLLSAGKPAQPARPPAGDRLLDVLDGPEAAGTAPNWTHWGYAGYALRGFLLNTVNPFTVFFWLGIATGVVIPNQWDGRETLSFFSGMMGALVMTDTLKAYAAKRVRRFLTPGHIRWVRLGIGATLIVFGLVLIVRVL